MLNIGRRSPVDGHPVRTQIALQPCLQSHQHRNRLCPGLPRTVCRPCDGGAGFLLEGTLALFHRSSIDRSHPLPAEKPASDRPLPYLPVAGCGKAPPPRNAPPMRLRSQPQSFGGRLLERNLTAGPTPMRSCQPHTTPEIKSQLVIKLYYADNSWSREAIWGQLLLQL